MSIKKLLPVYFSAFFVSFAAYANTPLRESTNTDLGSSLSDSQIMKDMQSSTGLENQSSSSHGGLMQGPKDPNAENAGESTAAYLAMVNNTKVKIEKTKKQIAEREAQLKQKTMELDGLNKVQKDLQKRTDVTAEQKANAQRALQAALVEVGQLKKDIALYKETIKAMEESNASAKARLGRARL